MEGLGRVLGTQEQRKGKESDGKGKVPSWQGGQEHREEKQRLGSAAPAQKPGC